jgi:hypothetical protein
MAKFPLYLGIVGNMFHHKTSNQKRPCMDAFILTSVPTSELKASMERLAALNQRHNTT